MMAAGKPVIVSEVGGLPENVTDGRDGWVVPPASVDSLVQALSQILANRAAVDRMGEEARSTALKEFSLATFVGKTESVYREGRAQQPYRLRLTS